MMKRKSIITANELECAKIAEVSMLLEKYSQYYFFVKNYA